MIRLPDGKLGQVLPLDSFIPGSAEVDKGLSSDKTIEVKHPICPDNHVKAVSANVPAERRKLNEPRGISEGNFPQGTIGQVVRLQDGEQAKLTPLGSRNGIVTQTQIPATQQQPPVVLKPTEPEVEKSPAETKTDLNGESASPKSRKPSAICPENHQVIELNKS